MTQARVGVGAWPPCPALGWHRRGRDCPQRRPLAARLSDSECAATGVDVTMSVTAGDGRAAAAVAGQPAAPRSVRRSLEYY